MKKNFKTLVIAAIMGCMVFGTVANAQTRTPKKSVAKTDTVVVVDETAIADSIEEALTEEETVTKADESLANTELALKKMELEHEERMYRYRHSNGDNVFGVCAILFVCFIPLLAFFYYLHKKQKNSQKREDEIHKVILELSKQGQAITPELVKALGENQKEEEKMNFMGKKNRSMSEQDRADINFTYNRMILGSAILILSLLIFLMGWAQVFYTITLVIGLLFLAQGLSRYFSLKEIQKNNLSDDKVNQNEQTLDK